MGWLEEFRAQPLNLPGTAFYHAIQCRKRLEEIFRVELEKKNGFNINNDLMDGLIQIKDDEGNTLSQQEVLDNIVILVAGFESTSLASMWAIYYLAKFPNVLKKLQEENMAITKKKQGTFITSEDFSELKYTNKVVEETIRMANVSSVIFRLVTKEVKGTASMTLEPVRPGTYQVFGVDLEFVQNMLARIQLALLLHHLSVRYR
ncbi:hypothetical protein DITRI_Ditri04bG0057600 [Diplodiscus trichospermus]